MTKVLIISNDNIGKLMAGPGIRYWWFANILAKDHKVTLMIPNELENEEQKKLNFNVISYSKNKSKLIKKYYKQNDIIICQGIPSYILLGLIWYKKKLIFDLYAPNIIETLEQYKNSPISDLFLKKIITNTTLFLKTGNNFICANSRQKDLYSALLLANHRISVSYYKTDMNFDKLIKIVPYGIDPIIPTHRENVIKGIIKGIKKDDKVIIWGGGIWNWFDPITLIKALANIS